MSLLKTNLEDLLVSKTNDARKIAKSTTAHDKDDLVSDPHRKSSDDDAQSAIDKALSKGHVYQETEVSKESLFSSLQEQQAFINYTALSNVIDPMTGSSMYDILDIQNICETCDNIEEFSNKLYKESTTFSYKLRRKFDENVLRLEDEVIKTTSNDLLLWESIVSVLEK